MMNTKTDFAKLLSKFFSEYLPHQRNVSQNTIIAYKDTFVQMITFIRDEKKIAVEKITLDTLNRQLVDDFLLWIQNKRNCSYSTRNYRLAAIHSFINYLKYEDVTKLNKWLDIMSIKAVKTEKKSMSYLTVDGMKLLLEQPDITNNRGRRNLVMLTLMYDIGARVQEIIDLTPSALRIGSKPYTIRIIGKGRKSRIVPLMEEQIELLKQYLEENRLQKEEMLSHPLFFNNRGEKLTRAGITYILKSYVRMAKNTSHELIPDNVSCHSLRHSRAMHLLQAGVGLIYIRDILGHVSIQTTEVYARADSRQKREALEKAYVKLTPNLDTKNLWESNKDLLNWLKGFS